LFLVPAAATAQITGVEDVARPVSLPDAVRMAQENSPQAALAQGTLRNARLASRAAVFAFAPNLNVSAALTWQKGQRIGQTGSLIDFNGPSKSYTDGMSFSMELFDGGRRFYDLSAARAGVQAADAGTIATRFLIAQSVKEQYYNVLAAREAESAARAQVDEAAQQLRAAAARLQAGAAIRSDSLRSMVLVGNAQLALITAQTDLSNANASLTRLVGSPELVTAADAPADEVLPPLDIARLREIVSNGPSVVQARSQLAAARAETRSARSSYLPTVNITYSRNGNGFDSQYGFASQFAYASSFRFNVSLPVFNQLVREQNAVRASVAQTQAAVNLRDAELRVQQELTAAVGQLRSAQQRVTVQQASVSAAEEDLNIQRQRYDLSASSLLDVLESQSQLNQARTSLIEARFDLRMARARLESLLGRELSQLAP
jgi:outer membrane protein